MDTGFKTFITDYQDFAKNLHYQKINQYTDNFNQLFDGYEKVKGTIQTREREKATKYNIFEVLNIKFTETSTHTPFLKNLLDPEGSHGQGALFLKSFLDKFVSNKGKLDHFYLSNDRDYWVQEEKTMTDGRIDIYIQSQSLQKNFAIVIENKLYAADQKGQLERYYKFLTKNLGLDKSKIMLFYLSPDGKNPTNHSMNLTLRECLKSEGVLQLISYQNDIRKWLQQSMQKVKPTKVKLLINQYIKILESV